MTYIINNIHKLEATLGILALTSVCLEGQNIDSYNRNKDKGHNYNNTCTFSPFERYNRKLPTVKVGATYNIIKRDKLSDEKDGFFDRGPGIEVLLESEFKRRLFLEVQIGMCALNDYKSITGALHYSEAHADLGIGYKPLIRNGWAIAVESLAGASDEFYKETVGPRTERIYLNVLVGSSIEKVFDNGLGLGVAVSREIDRNYWRLGLRLIVKPEGYKTHKHNNNFNRRSSRW